MGLKWCLHEQCGELADLARLLPLRRLLATEEGLLLDVFLNRLLIRLATWSSEVSLVVVLMMRTGPVLGIFCDLNVHDRVLRVLLE